MLELWRFEAWGHEIAEEVIGYYPITQRYVSVQQCYDDLSADINVKCGNIDNAIRASQQFQSPIYFYVSTQFPSHPFCVPFISGSLSQPRKEKMSLSESPYCARYAYHTWDLIALLDSMW